MRALLLLLVLVGMAEVGWGQYIEPDTSRCFPDTFITVNGKNVLARNRHLYSEDFDAISNDSFTMCITYNKAGFRGSAGFLSKNIMRLRNKELQKKYFYHGWEFGNYFFATERLAIGFRAFIDHRTFAKDVYEDTFSHFFRDVGLDANEFIFTLGITTAYALIEKRRFGIYLNTNLSSLHFAPKLEGTKESSAVLCGFGLELNRYYNMGGICLVKIQLE